MIALQAERGRSKQGSRLKQAGWQCTVGRERLSDGTTDDPKNRQLRRTWEKRGGEEGGQMEAGWQSLMWEGGWVCLHNKSIKEKKQISGDTSDSQRNKKKCHFIWLLLYQLISMTFMGQEANMKLPKTIIISDYHWNRLPLEQCYRNKMS